MKCLVRYNRKSFYTLSLQKSSNYTQLFHKRFTVNRWSIDSNLASNLEMGSRRLCWIIRNLGSLTRICPFGRILETVKSQSFLIRQVKKGQKVVAIVVNPVKRLSFLGSFTDDMTLLTDILAVSLRDLETLDSLLLFVSRFFFFERVFFFVLSKTFKVPTRKCFRL